MDKGLLGILETFDSNIRTLEMSGGVSDGSNGLGDKADEVSNTISPSMVTHLGKVWQLGNVLDE